MDPVNNPTPAPAPSPAPAPAPPAPTPPPPTPPVGNPTTMEGGDEVRGIDWTGWILAALGVTALTLIIWKTVKQAQQSKKFADTQESLEARVAYLESQLAKKANSNSLIPLF